MKVAVWVVCNLETSDDVDAMQKTLDSLVHQTQHPHSVIISCYTMKKCWMIDIEERINTLRKMVTHVALIDQKTPLLPFDHYKFIFDMGHDADWVMFLEGGGLFGKNRVKNFVEAAKKEKNDKEKKKVAYVTENVSQTGMFRQMVDEYRFYTVTPQLFDSAVTATAKKVPDNISFGVLLWYLSAESSARYKNSEDEVDYCELKK